MLLSLVRKNCSGNWYWQYSNGSEVFAGLADASEPCSVNRGAFKALDLVRVNPDNFTMTGWSKKLDSSLLDVNRHSFHFRASNYHRKSCTGNDSEHHEFSNRLFIFISCFIFLFAQEGSER
ncbi:unnamed protein product [Caenorhabditis auriculariae]|uniref:Uncharacterized protein n=1 Tax=Caenorhabditis auriculariae TaxID=2777116 RepID=A0A8S1GYI3_9PELO|nr:unnamed protein product [Caenorhabditis auriculariae]